MLRDMESKTKPNRQSESRSKQRLPHRVAPRPFVLPIRQARFSNCDIKVKIGEFMPQNPGQAWLIWKVCTGGLDRALSIIQRIGCKRPGIGDSTHNVIAARQD